MLPRCRVLVLAVAVAGAGCSSDFATGPAPTADVQPQFAVGDPVAATLIGEQFTVCNDAGAGAYFDVFEDGAATPTRTIQILDHTCRLVSSLLWPLNPPDVFGHSVRVVERVPTWWRVQSVHLLVGHEAVQYPRNGGLHAAEVRVDQTSAPGINSVTGPINAGHPLVDDYVGSLASFVNVRIPDGTQACSARFFRLHSAPPRKGWVGHTPLDLFVTAFGVNAFPGRNLYWLLNTDAGGLTGFGRQAVTALLNASNPAVNFGMWPAEVIQVFKDVYGHPELYDDASWRLAQRNAQGPCPY